MQAALDFTKGHGPDVRPQDAEVLKGLFGAVYRHLLTHGAVTLAELEQLTGASNATVSARVRDVRAYVRPFGGDVKRERIGDTRLFSYRLVLP